MLALVFMYLLMCTCMGLLTPICMSISVSIPVSIPVSISIFVFIYRYVWRYIDIYMYTCTCVYVYICIHRYMLPFFWGGEGGFKQGFRNRKPSGVFQVAHANSPYMNVKILPPLSKVPCQKGLDVPSREILSSVFSAAEIVVGFPKLAGRKRRTSLRTGRHSSWTDARVNVFFSYCVWP